VKRVDTALVVIAVVLAAVWYVLRVAPSSPEPAGGAVSPPPVVSAPARRPSGAGGDAARPAISRGAPSAESPADVTAAIEVVHKHKLGSCRGRLSVGAAGLRYEPTRPGHGFAVPLASVERLESDPRKKVLAVKLRGGRTYNFTDPGNRPEPLQAFQKAFAKPRPRVGATP
jgi:hypothetical protein